MKKICIGSVWLTVMIGLAEITSYASPPVFPSPNVRIHYLSISDAKPGAHVWQVSGQTASVYNSLASPKLRAWLNRQPKGFVIGLEALPTPTTASEAKMDLPTTSVAPTAGVILGGCEVKEFGTYCTAHGFLLEYLF